MNYKKGTFTTHDYQIFCRTYNFLVGGTIPTVFTVPGTSNPSGPRIELWEMWTRMVCAELRSIHTFIPPFPIDDPDMLAHQSMYALRLAFAKIVALNKVISDVDDIHPPIDHELLFAVLEHTSIPFSQIKMNLAAFFGVSNYGQRIPAILSSEAIWLNQCRLTLRTISTLKGLLNFRGKHQLHPYMFMQGQSTKKFLEWAVSQELRLFNKVPAEHYTVEMFKLLAAAPPRYSLGIGLTPTLLLAKFGPAYYSLYKDLPIEQRAHVMFIRMKDEMFSFAGLRDVLVPEVFKGIFDLEISMNQGLINYVFRAARELHAEASFELELHALGLATHAKFTYNYLREEDRLGRYLDTTEGRTSLLDVVCTLEPPQFLYVYKTLLPELTDYEDLLRLITAAKAKIDGYELFKPCDHLLMAYIIRTPIISMSDLKFIPQKLLKRKEVYNALSGRILTTALDDEAKFLYLYYEGNKRERNQLLLQRPVLKDE